MVEYKYGYKHYATTSIHRQSLFLHFFKSGQAMWFILIIEECEEIDACVISGTQASRGLTVYVFASLNATLKPQWNKACLVYWRMRSLMEVNPAPSGNCQTHEWGHFERFSSANPKLKVAAWVRLGKTNRGTTSAKPLSSGLKTLILRLVIRLERYCNKNLWDCDLSGCQWLKGRKWRYYYWRLEEK